MLTGKDHRKWRVCVLSFFCVSWGDLMDNSTSIVYPRCSYSFAWKTGIQLRLLGTNRKPRSFPLTLLSLSCVIQLWNDHIMVGCAHVKLRYKGTSSASLYTFFLSVSPQEDSLGCKNMLLQETADTSSCQTTPHHLSLLSLHPSSPFYTIQYAPFTLLHRQTAGWQSVLLKAWNIWGWMQST